jgi:hypothetical protein
VARGAEDAVIRAAYRALMRLYHPDRNDDPEAQTRAREITAAFAVLRDPAKRAAYDISQGLGNEWDPAEPARFEGGRRPLPPMRNFGIASVTLALAASLAFAVWPEWKPPSRPPSHRPAAAVRATTPTQPRAAPPVKQESAPAPPVEAAPIPTATEPEPVPPAALEREALSAPPEKRPPRVVRREVTKVEPTKAPAPVLPSLKEKASRAAEAGCDSRCLDDRKAQIERMASSFFKQSMDHADWSKQQLLLSARNRSATSRTLCHSEECVTAAYLRQMRDTTDIMQGRIPGE